MELREKSGCAKLKRRRVEGRILEKEMDGYFRV